MFISSRGSKSTVMYHSNARWTRITTMWQLLLAKSSVMSSKSVSRETHVSALSWNRCCCQGNRGDTLHPPTQSGPISGLWYAELQYSEFSEFSDFLYYWCWWLYFDPCAAEQRSAWFGVYWQRLECWAGLDAGNNWSQRNSGCGGWW